MRAGLHIDAHHVSRIEYKEMFKGQEFLKSFVNFTFFLLQKVFQAIFSTLARPTELKLAQAIFSTLARPTELKLAHSVETMLKSEYFTG